MSECTTHHICICKAERMAALEKEVKKLRRENERLNKLTCDTERMKALFAAAKDAEKLLAPFMEDSE